MSSYCQTDLTIKFQLSPKAAKKEPQIWLKPPSIYPGFRFSLFT